MLRDWRLRLDSGWSGYRYWDTVTSKFVLDVYTLTNYITVQYNTVQYCTVKYIRLQYTTA